MEKCSRCGAVLDGPVCSGCGARAPGAPLVDVYVAQGEVDAQVVRSLLDAHGIDCILSGEALRLTHGFTVNGLGEVRVLVRESDAEAARELIATRDV